MALPNVVCFTKSFSRRSSIVLFSVGDLLCNVVWRRDGLRWDRSGGKYGKTSKNFLQPETSFKKLLQT